MGQLTMKKEVWWPPCTHKINLKRLFSVNLVVILLLSCENVLIRRVFSCPFSAYSRRRRSALVRRISIKAVARRCPSERKWTVMSRSSLMKHDLIWSICKSRGTWSVSRAVFGKSGPVIFWYRLQHSHFSGILTEPSLKPSTLPCNV